VQVLKETVHQKQQVLKETVHLSINVSYDPETSKPNPRQLLHTVPSRPTAPRLQRAGA
jgi:hypothetical protein